MKWDSTYIMESDYSFCFDTSPKDLRKAFIISEGILYIVMVDPKLEATCCCKEDDQGT